MFEVKMNQVLNENERLLEQVINKDIVNIIMNSSMDNAYVNVHECEKCLKLETELLNKKDFIEKETYDKLFRSYTTLEKHCISLEVDTQLNQEIFQRDNSVSNQSALNFDQYFELNELKAQSQEKDTVIKKLKERIKSLSGNMNKDKVKKDIEEIETINIELDHRVSKLIAENEHLNRPIRNFMTQSNQHEKGLVITALKDELRKLKEKDLADNIVTKHTIAPDMLKFDVEPIAPKLLNNRTAHSDYLRTFTIVGNACPLTRITTTTEVTLRKPTALETDTPKPVVTLVYLRKPRKSKTNVPVVQIVLWYLDSGCSKHMTEDSSQLVNFVNKFLGTVKFRNDHVAKILGYGDYQIGNVTISRVFYVEGLGHNLFSVGQFSSKTKSWLWHRRLSHLNFSTLNKLAKDGLARGIPRLKFQKDHLCLACALGKSKKSSHQLKAEDTNQEKLYLLHMDLCGLIRVARLKDEAPDAIIKCIQNTQVHLNAYVRKFRTQASFYDSCYIQCYYSVPTLFLKHLVFRPKGKMIGNRCSIYVDNTSILHPLLFLQFKKAAALRSMTYSHSLVSTIIDQEASSYKIDEGSSIANVNRQILHRSFSTRNATPKLTPCDKPFPWSDKLKKALYGLKQAPRAWYDMLLSFVISQHFSKGAVDPTLFTWQAGNDLLLAKPTEKHLQAMKRIFQYLKGTINMGLWYSKDTDMSLTSHADFDHAGCQDTRRSTSGSAQFLGDKLLTDYGFQFNKIPLYCDNKSAISLCCNNVQHSQAKYIDVRYHFIKEQIKNGIVELYFDRTEYQLADIFTKPLPRERFNFLIEKLSMRSMSLETDE
ncbi:retrovirus-related pol polyprotein from transposon TNT 1-94 [Tanacetum coccineum]